MPLLGGAYFAIKNNKDLQDKYDQMHSQGPSSWFSDGQEEREAIINMGNPWENMSCLEIGCGEGDLSVEISKRTKAPVVGIDYSIEAIRRAIQKNKRCNLVTFRHADYREYSSIKGSFHRIVMQGVLEHLDHPFTELKWMIDNLLVPGGDVITSSPCFLNPRGIVWMTLNMLGAVMSKTDLHYLHPWDFSGFCMEHGYSLVNMNYCDWDWGNGEKMIDDLKKRIPLALKDGNIPYTSSKVDDFLNYLQRQKGCDFLGATAVYRIQT